MPLFSLKSNPFDDEYASRWEGAGRRAENAVAAAVAEATEVLTEEVRTLGEKSGLRGEVLDAVQPLNYGQVGIPHGALAREAVEEEFGTLEKAPKGVMRRAQRRARQEAEATFSEVLHEELFG